MQLSNGRRAVYITISILIAFFLWFYVNNDEEVELNLSEVGVEFPNGDATLANKGLVLTSSDDAKVDVVLSMPRSLVYSFDTDHVHLIADLSSVGLSGVQSVPYSIIYPVGVNPSQITVKSPTVRNVSVRIGELYRKTDVEVRCKLVGTVADGYAAGRVQLLPDTLEVWGQQSDVVRVSYALVTLNIENARSTIVEQLEFELYDENDALIESSSIRASSSTVQVTMPVISATAIPLSVRFIEEPGVRLDSFDYTLTPAAVTLSGDSTQIAELGEIQLDEIPLADLEEGEHTFIYDIPIPEGLNNLSGVTEATLIISNRDVATEDMTVTNFDYENFGAEDRVVEVVTSSLSVTLRGTEETLSGITPSMVTAVADLSGVTNASGAYTVPANIRVEGDPDVGATRNYQLTVRILPPEELEGEGAEPGEETTP